MPSTATAIPFVLQRDFISVVVNGQVTPVSKGQATFPALYKALERGQWARVPKLLTLTAQIAEKSHGKVSVTADGIFYKGQKVDNSLTAKISELIEHGKPVAAALRFMDNLYQQPDMNTVNEIYEWLASGRFALTEDGCFIAYKKVGADYKDLYTHSVDNHVGQRPLMPRSEVDPDRTNTCSQGYHFCSRSYLPNYGAGWTSGKVRIMEVKVNPADVVAIPIDYNYAKGRTWTYEVIREVQANEMIEGTTDSPVMMQPIIEVEPERKALIKQVKALPTVQRLMRRGKMKAESFRKASTDRLTNWLRRFSRMDIAPVKSKLFDNPLRFAREAAGLTMGQVAKAANMRLQDVYNAERCQHPKQEDIDMILIAIAKLQGNEVITRAGVCYPRPAAKGTHTSPVTSVIDDDDDDYEDEDEDDDY